jgi:hypothetical protein
MSRAGKFIPGGGGGKAVPGRDGPIRAPDPSAPNDPSAPPGAKKPFGKGSLVKPVAKNQRLPIVVMSAACCLLISIAAGYYLAYLPAVRARDEAEQEKRALQKQLDDEALAIEKEKQDALNAAKTAHGTLSVDSNPSGATVTIGDFRRKTPASFADIIPGTVSIVIHLDGYEDYQQNATITADQPTDLGTINLVQKTGNLSLTCPQSNVTYTLTGPGNYSHDGQVPDKVEKLPVGDYLVTAAQGDWKLAPVPVTIQDHETAQKEIKFPYASLKVTSVPPGATVRDGRNVLGQTPLALTQLRPRDFHLSVDLPPYTLQRLDISLPDFGDVNKQVTLHQDKDFIAACGMPMVWISDGGFWAGKYLVRQCDIETVGADDPSTFRRPNRPVETISWDSATAFCDKLNDYERKAGKLPQGYHYALPKEEQWETFSADANIDQAATSRISTLSATQDVGYSEPNKYDTIGNVWEWCVDNFDDKGDHSLRGGCWLSSLSDFPNAETRNAGGPKYADRFTGFRVVLVPN